MLSNAYEGIKSEDGKNAVVELDVTFLKQEDDFPALLELCRKAKENRDLLVIVSRTVTEYVDRLRAIADLNMKAWQLGSYLLTEGNDHEYPSVRVKIHLGQRSSKPNWGRGRLAPIFNQTALSVPCTPPVHLSSFGRASTTCLTAATPTLASGPSPPVGNSAAFRLSFFR